MLHNYMTIQFFARVRKMFDNKFHYADGRVCFANPRVWFVTFNRNFHDVQFAGRFARSPFAPRTVRASHGKHESCPRLNFTRFFAPVPEQLFAAVSHNARLEKIARLNSTLLAEPRIPFHRLEQGVRIRLKQEVGSGWVEKLDDDFLTKLWENEYNGWKKWNKKKKIQVFNVLMFYNGCYVSY